MCVCDGDGEYIGVSGHVGKVLLWLYMGLLGLSCLLRGVIRLRNQRCARVKLIFSLLMLFFSSI